jgi:nicotinate-nucleotide pyrophosphorylase (carboxylating)
MVTKDIKPLDISKVMPLIKLAVAEDFGDGDPTSEITIDAGKTAVTMLRSREDIVVCGMAVAREVLKCYDMSLEIKIHKPDGSHAAAGELLAEISGPLRAMLSAERVLLNFLQRLSGVATLTARYVKEVEGTKAGIYDTRKTTPGWRELEKYAVRCGGGFNHRYNLGDAVMLKDNHFAHLGSDHAGELRKFVDKSRSTDGVKFVSVEVDHVDWQLDIVLNVPGVDVILLDNMSVDEYKLAVEKRNLVCPGKPLLEASGGITLDNLRSIAQTGVERISIGAITHGARAVDIGLDK